MTPPTNTGGQAFPYWNCSENTTPGMSLRAYLASKETLADYDHPESWGAYQNVLITLNGNPPTCVIGNTDYLVWEAQARAKIKLLRADALVAELNQEEAP